jgi:4,5-dihydroxyphthalate decarboxylase
MAFDSKATAEAQSSARLELSIALSDNENTRPLLDGEIQPQGVKLLPSAVHPSEMFWRQLKFGDFDISEMSMSSLTIATSHGPTPWVALPVFTTREFFHTRILVRADAGLDVPADLRNTRMGVPEYQQTAAIWGRGVLQHEFGVHPREIDWYMERTPDKSHGGATAFTPPHGVRVTQVPPATDLGEMLLRGELHGTLLYLANRNLVDRSRADLTADPRFKYLFPDRKAEGRRYFAKNGIYPINHAVVVRRSLLERHPWLALNLYHAFAAARAEVVRRGQLMLKSYDDLGLLGADTQRALAFDPMAYGVKANRRVLDTITQYVHEQGLTPRRVGLEEIFASSTLDL